MTTLPMRFTLAALLAGLLAACAAPAPQPTSASAPPAATPSESTPASTPAAPSSGAPTASPAQSKGTPVAIDRSCRTNADCAIKDVGSCCGAMPACVNKNSPTDPKAVQAECAKRGMVSTCGFKEITACTCTNGQCVNVQEPVGGWLDDPPPPPTDR